MNGILDSEVRFTGTVGLTSEFDLLGTSIYAHLSSLPGLFARRNILAVPPTIQGLGFLFANPRKISGFRGAWMGKAFEYAVADLFAHRREPYYSLICEGVESAVSVLVSDRVNRVALDIDNLHCVRVAKEAADAEDLIREFGRFRMLRNASRTLRNAASMHPGLEDKVDVIFCERESDPAYRFAVTVSLKISRRQLVQDSVRQDFRTFPLDLAISIATPKYRGVMFDEELGVFVVYMPLNVEAGVHAWENAVRMVDKALTEGEKKGLLQYFRSFFKPDTPERYWVEFLADRLQMEIGAVAQEICEILHGTPTERVVSLPVLLGTEQDIIVDLSMDAVA